MKKSWWVVGLGILLLIIFNRLKNGSGFNGISSQRGLFGTPGTPVDSTGISGAEYS